mgnify:CR=1 FL=1
MVAGGLLKTSTIVFDDTKNYSLKTVDGATNGIMPIDLSSIGGVDAFDDAVQLTELACRVYSTDRGLAGLPTVDQLAASLRSKGEASQR